MISRCLCDIEIISQCDIAKLISHNPFNEHICGTQLSLPPANACNNILCETIMIDNFLFVVLQVRKTLRLSENTRALSEVWFYFRSLIKVIKITGSFLADNEPHSRLT